MNRDDIIYMAREACSFGQQFNSDEEWTIRFAALVAAAEREACINVCAPYRGDHYVEACVSAMYERGQS